MSWPLLKWRFFVFLCCFGVTSFWNYTFSQSNPTIDSLLQVLEKTDSPKEKVDLHNKIAYWGDTDSSLVATQSKQAIDLAKKIDYLEGISLSLIHI